MSTGRLGPSKPSVEEVLLRRKAAAALSVLREDASKTATVPPPTHLLASLSRSRTAPNQLRTSTPALSEAVAFGRRAPLPPSPARTSILPMAKPPSAFVAMAQTMPGYMSAGTLRGSRSSMQLGAAVHHQALGFH